MSYSLRDLWSKLQSWDQLAEQGSRQPTTQGKNLFFADLRGFLGSEIAEVARALLAQDPPVTRPPQEGPMQRDAILSESRVFAGVCFLRCAVQSTGLCGGDSGHGGWSRVHLSDLGSTDLRGSIGGDLPTSTEQVVIEVGGDAELRVLADALLWAAQQLAGLLNERAALAPSLVRWCQSCQEYTRQRIDMAPRPPEAVCTTCGQREQAQPVAGPDGAEEVR